LQCVAVCCSVLQCVAVCCHAWGVLGKRRGQEGDRKIERSEIERKREKEREGERRRERDTKRNKDI